MNRSVLHQSRFSLGAAVLGLAVLGGCANPGPRYPASNPAPAPYPNSQPVPYSGQQQPYPSQSAPYQSQRAPGALYGHVESVELIKAENQTTGAGAVLGGVLGAVVGRQIGKGSGRTAATAVGAVGGAIAGNQIEKSRANTSDFVRITVRLDQGGTRQFDYEPGLDIRQGDRVYVQNDQLMRY